MKRAVVACALAIVAACSQSSHSAQSQPAAVAVNRSADCATVLPSFSSIAAGRVERFDNGGLPGPTGQMTAGAGMQTSAVWPDPCSSTLIVAATAHQAAPDAPIVPFVTLIDGADGRVKAGPTQIAADTTSGASSSQHDIPFVALAFTGGFSCVAYGAQSTYRAYSPPSQWFAFNATGGAGTDYAAQPMVCGSNLSDPADADSFLCASSCAVTPDSNKVFMPVSGISEGALANTCTSPGCVEVLSGQVQSNAACSGACNVISGASAYATFHVTGKSAGYWDTTCGRQAMSEGAVASSLCLGVSQVTHPPQGGDYFHFTVTSTNGGNESLTVNRCTFSYAPQSYQPPDQVAQSVADAYNAACPQTYHAVASKIDNGTVGIEYTKDVLWTALAAAPDVSCDGGAFTCGPTVTDSCNCASNQSGYEHFDWGAIKAFDGTYYQLQDVQLQTTSYRGGQHNNNALALALWVSSGPDAHGVWSWCDMSWKNCTDVAPNAAPPLPLLGMGPGGSCTPDADCSEPSMPPVTTYCQRSCTASQGTSPYLIRPPSSYSAGFPHFCYDWGPEANATCGVPVTSQRDWAVAGNDLFVAYPCVATTLNPATICALQVDMPSKRTLKTWIVDHADNGYPTAFQMALALAANPSGELAITVGIGNSAGWSHDQLCMGSGTCIVQYRLKNPGATWSKGRTLVNSLGGKNTAGIPCVMHSSPQAPIVNASCATGESAYPTTGGLYFFQFKT